MPERDTTERGLALTAPDDRNVNRELVYANIGAVTNSALDVGHDQALDVVESHLAEAEAELRELQEAADAE